MSRPIGGLTRYAESADGTRIAYEARGTGPTLVIVEGALCHRGMGAFDELAPLLADRFTLVGYDRRGRGESDSGASQSSVASEVEDLIAVLDAVAPAPFVFGGSSGAALSLEAGRAGVPMARLALYEPPFILDDSHPADDPAFTEELRTLIASGQRTPAVKKFLRLMGVPAPVLLVMPLLPIWKQLTASADALPNDFEIVSPYRRGLPLPEGHFASITADTLLMAGGKSPPYMQRAPAAIAAQMPRARTATLPGQTHEVKAEVIAPLLAAHFAGG